LNADSIELSVGSKLARVEPRAVAKSVEMLDWIDQVKVSRNWLGRSVKISVVEKQAVAKSVSIKDGLINFDASGAIFKPVSIKQLSIQKQLPLVIVAEDEKSLLASVATLLSQLPPKSSELVVNLKSISVSSSGLIQMETSIRAQSLQINWGLARDIALKVRVLNALLKLPENKDISRVDLSQPELPIVS
jgi:cell division septal protein FtsQ